MPENNLLEVGRLVYSKPYLISAQSDARAWSEVDTPGMIFNLRNISNEEIVISKLDAGFYTTTLSSAQPVAVAAGWYKTVNHTVLAATGARAFPITFNRRRRADVEVFPAADAEAAIAGAAALTGATFQFNGQVNDPIHQLICDIPVGAIVAVSGRSSWDFRDGIPLSLGPNEGLVFLNRVAFSAGLQGRFNIGVEFHRA